MFLPEEDELLPVVSYSLNIEVESKLKLDNFPLHALFITLTIWMLPLAYDVLTSLEITETQEVTEAIEAKTSMGGWNE